VADHSAFAEHCCKRSNRKIRGRVPVKIIHEHTPPRDTPHLFEHAHAVLIRQMVKEEGCHDDVKAFITERKPKGVASNRKGFRRQFQASRIQIQNNDSAGSPPKQGFAHVACAGRNIEDQKIGTFRQKSLDCADPAKPSIDDFQFPISRGELMLRLAEIIHNLVFVCPLPKAR
jgi:hypothetical protein